MKQELIKRFEEETGNKEPRKKDATSPLAWGIDHRNWLKALTNWLIDIVIADLQSENERLNIAHATKVGELNTQIARYIEDDLILQEKYDKLNERVLKATREERKMWVQFGDDNEVKEYKFTVALVELTPEEMEMKDEN